MVASVVVVASIVVVASVVVVAVVGFPGMVGIAAGELVAAMDLPPGFAHGIRGGPVKESTFATGSILVLYLKT